jgi:CDP-glucose 4,6-dehydratase
MENLVSFENLARFYSGKKGFITGLTGFKGAWLSACLHLLNAEIKGYSLAPEYENGLYDLLKPRAIFESVIADIRDKKQLEDELISFKPDFVFHLAAQPLVRRSYKLPTETFETNVIGTANLLEVINKLPGKCTIVVITTDKVYENIEANVLYKEEDRLGGYDPYSASKACTEIVVDSFRHSFFNVKEFTNHNKAIASVRAGNVIGGGDWSEDRIVPDIVRALQNNEPIKVRSPKAIRPWQHVLEPIGAYLLLGGLLNNDFSAYSKAYNIGPYPQDHLTVGQLAETAIERWGTGKWLDASDNNNPHEAGLLKLNIEQAEKELNWHPKLNSKKAIEWTIDWYKQTIENQANYSFQQIKDYFTL